jgi:pyruvate kinase
MNGPWKTEERRGPRPDYGAVTLAGTHAEIAAIACCTRTGRTAGILASLRPRVPVIAFTPDAEVGARLALINAVVPRLSVALDESDRLGRLNGLLGEAGLLGDGTTVILVSSTSTPGSAPNLLGIQRVVVADERAAAATVSPSIGLIE